MSVECAVIEAGQNSGNETIEFTGQNIRDKAYADNKVVFEFGFYINNNARYSAMLPLRLNHKLGGKDWGNSGNNQVCPINSTQVPPLMQHIAGASLGFSHKQGQQYDFFYAIDIVGNAEPTINSANWTGGTKNGKIKYLLISNDEASTGVQSIQANTATNGCFNRVVNSFYPPVPPLVKWSMQYSTTPQVSPEKNGWNMEGYNFEITVGMAVSIEGATGSGNAAGSDPPNQRRILGIVDDIISGSSNITAIKTAKANLSTAGIDIGGNLIIVLRDEYEVNGSFGVPDNYLQHSGIIGVTQLGGWTRNGGQSYSAVAQGTNVSAGSALSDWDRKCKGSINMGIQNWSAGIVKPIKNLSPNPYSDFDVQGASATNDDVVNSEPAPASNHYLAKMKETNLMRKLGGGFGFEVMRTATDELLMCPQESCCEQPSMPIGGGDVNGIKVSTMNFMDYKDNLPYIMVCPSYQGCQTNPNGTAMCPDLQPMTAFIVVEATETFEDVTFLARRITEAFHAVNPFENLSGKGSNTRNGKENNCIPYCHRGYFPLYWRNAHYPTTPAVSPIDVPNIAPNFAATPTESEVNPMRGKQNALYSSISPCWDGNLIKVLPANGSLGANLATQQGSPYFWSPDTDTDYLSSGGADLDAKKRGTFNWWGGWFSNMGVKNLSRYMMGDRLNKHSETWNLNQFSVNPDPNEPLNVKWLAADCGRIVVMNTQLRRQLVQNQNPEFTFATQEDIGTPAYQPFVFWGADVDKYQAIMTNMYYTQNNINLLKEVLGMVEKYDVDAPDASDDEKVRQSQPHNWYWECDLGQADSSKQPRDKFQYIQNFWNTDYASGTTPANNPTNPNFVGDGDNGHFVPYYLLETVDGFWKEQPPPMSLCNPHPSGMATHRIISGQQPAVLAYGGVNNEYGVALNNTPYANKSCICPAQCVVGNGWNSDYQEAKRTGIIKLHSRWFPEMDSNPNIPDFSLEQGNQCNVYNCFPVMKNGAKDNNLWFIDPTMSREAGIAAAPYIYNPRDAGAPAGQAEDGSRSQKHFICFMAYRDYKPQNNDISTWELNQFSWGDYLGFSPSPYDNQCIVPMNNDKMDLDGRTYFTQMAAPYNKTELTPNPAHFWNRNNYIWCGAGNSVCEFDSQSNRFRIGGLYTETKLPQLNVTGSGVTATPQVGEQEITLGANTNTTTQDIWTEENDGFPSTGQTGNPVNNPASYYDECCPPSTWFANGAVLQNYDPELGQDPAPTYSRRDQGIRDVQCGVFLHKIWLAPEGWTPPQGIDLQNYYDPTVSYENDPTVNMGNATGAAGGSTQLDGTKWINKTKRNRDAITANLVEASDENWEGCLLDKMGFNYRDLMPRYGEQSNRFSEFTYGSEKIKTMYKGTKPLIQNSQSDSAANISMSVYASPTPAATEGTPLFGQGFLNNEEINIGNLNVGSVAASRFPVLFSCPFYSIVSNIVETQFQSSDQAQNVIFVGMKNYNVGQYFYISASDYSQYVDEDRLLTEISTEIRNPNTGRLARLSPNSCVVYKVERDIFIPNPEIGADGENLLEPQPDAAQNDEISQHLHNTLGEYTPQELKELAKEEVRATTRIMTEGASAVQGDAPRHIIDTLTTVADREMKQSMEVSRELMESSFRREYIGDRERLMSSIYKLAVEKALENMRVVDRGRQMLNPFIMAREINTEWGNLARRISELDGRDEPMTAAAILKELRTPEVFIGRNGQVVKRRGRPRGQRQGQLAGNYTFNDDLYDKIIAVISDEGRDVNVVERLRKVLQTAIENKEIGYKGGKNEENPPSQEELYKMREERLREIRGDEAFKRASQLGGTKKERRRAVAMANRYLEEMAGDGYSDEYMKAARKRELTEARANPVAYMRNRAKENERLAEEGGGGGGDDSPQARTAARMRKSVDKVDDPPREERIERLERLSQVVDAEQQRGVAAAVAAKKGIPPRPSIPSQRLDTAEQMAIDRREALARQAREAREEAAAYERRRRPVKSARKFK